MPAGKPFKGVYEELGYKKLTESLKSIPDVVQVACTAHSRDSSPHAATAGRDC